MGSVVPDHNAVRVCLVEELPAACGGGVAQIEPDGIMWLLLEPPREGDAGADEGIDLAEWVRTGYELMERGEPSTCTDRARHHGVDVSVARAAFWSFAWEWFLLSSMASS